MPKYTVDEVLDIIKSLTAEEKTALQSQLSVILGTGATSNLQAQTQQSQSFGNITMRDGNEVKAEQFSAEGSVNISETNANIQGGKADIKEAFELLSFMKQELSQTDNLNALEKKDAQSKIEFVEEELKKSKPDQDLITQAVEALEKGLKGVEKLIEPTIKVAKLVGSAIFI
ncbi:hypothetical protein [Microcoleus sp. FACHB-672]|uniref:hypothetical protein n=1 Tax=Microcoleus sp. FACHB-672 TaxID=2692825 RepID=UPI001689F4FA|nr:hypothetical protein [Microcoleus sp. FACHB-672]MBD2043918.1 hypothetical protein [Microcoleus sp. FACHB-672]